MKSNQPLKTKQKIEDHIPVRKWDLDYDTKFVQFLNVANIERLYQKINLIDLSKVSEKNYFYVKGCLDTLYALIGVDTPLKRVIEKELGDFADDRLIAYISSITSFVDEAKNLKKITVKTVKENKDPSTDSTKDLIHHILNKMEEHEQGINEE